MDDISTKLFFSSIGWEIILRLSFIFTFSEFETSLFGNQNIFLRNVDP